MKKFLVWQTFMESEQMEVMTDYAIHAAETYAEVNCLTRDTSVFFMNQFDNVTKRFHNQEIGSVYVTEQ